MSSFISILSEFLRYMILLVSIILSIPFYQVVLHLKLILIIDIGRGEERRGEEESASALKNLAWFQKQKAQAELLFPCASAF